LLWVKGLATGAGFNVRVFDPDVFPVSIQGPKSDLLLSRLIDTPTQDIRRFRFIEAKIAGLDLLIARTGWSGQGGFEFYLAESARGIDLWDTIVGAATDLNLRSGCPNLIDRIETGLLSHGNDMTLSNNPIEAGLDRFFKLGKDSHYLGRQALEAIASSGPSQRMVRIMVPGSGITNPREIYPMTVSGSEQAGRVTSICHSPRMHCHVGFAYAPADACSPGTRITVSTPAGDAEGQIADQHWRVEASVN
jgi:dimethylsulfoniopropionate demethylase